MTTRGDLVHELIEATREVRAAVAEVSYPLPVPSAGPARADRAALLAQVDDYLLPRLSSPDAPLLVVVGGSTGAGKSTLVNSLVRAPVSQAGVLRPTTRSPVLVCHPADTAWFRSGPLGSLATPPKPMVAPAVPAGLALLDVPDFDSAGEGNRALAVQLLAAADLWLFVTTAARYADAVPWELLHTARERGTVVALVLDRVPPHETGTAEVAAHLTELLTGYGLAGAPLFVLPETRVDGQGLLPEQVVVPLRSWFDRLSGDPSARAAVARYTLDGALAALLPRIEALAAAVSEQSETAEALAEQVGLAYGNARATLEAGMRTEPPPGPGPGAAGRRGRRGTWEASLVTLVRSAAANAAEQVRTAWRAHPAGAALLDGPGVGPWPEPAGAVDQIVRAWPGGAREELLERIVAVLDGQAEHWLDHLAGVPPDDGAARRLRGAGGILEAARVAAAVAAERSTPPRAGPTGSAEPSGLAEPSELAGRG